MASWRAVAGTAWLVTLTVLAGPVRAAAGPMAPQAAGSGLDPAYLDKLLAPAALYPDQPHERRAQRHALRCLLGLIER